MVPKSLVVKVSRTIQTEQYHPLTLESVETYEIEEDTSPEEYAKQKAQAFSRAASRMYKMIEREADRYRA